MRKNGEVPGQGFGIVLSAALIIFFIKLFLSHYVYGTNDITSWIKFSMFTERFGTFKIYSLVSDYNHPPLMSWILKLIVFLTNKTQLSFPYLFRLMPITADFLSVLVIWKLLQKHEVKNKVLICLICAINPINFLISAFHGNTDPVFIFLILFAIYLIEDNKVILAGIIYGLSLCIKIVPIILIPVFFYFLKLKKQRTEFFLSSLLVFLIIFLPYLIYDYHSVIKNIFLYKSFDGVWGISQILSSIYGIENINLSLKSFIYGICRFHMAYFILIFFLIEIALIKFLASCKKLNLVDLSFFAFSLFLTLTPGFGIQYLSWLSFFAILTFPLLGSIYGLLGGVFLYRVYIYWGGGIAPYYANSWILGPWIGINAVLGNIIWLLILVMLILLFKDRKILSDA